MDFELSNFDDSFFDGGALEKQRRRAGESARPGARKYTAKACSPEWFNGVAVGGSSEERDHVILKYRADLCYHRRQLKEATLLYLQVLEVLPSSNTTVHREVIDSLTRCYLATGKHHEALQHAKQLVAPPHDNDASSWQLMALCYQALQQTEDHVISLQKCNLLQRHHAPYWLQLAEAYVSLNSICTERGSCRSVGVETGDAIFSNSEANFSNSALDDEPDIHHSHDTNDIDTATAPRVIFSNMEAILSNTVTLFRPYFKWESTDNDCLMDFKSLLATVSALLGRQVSVETFVKDLQVLPWEQRRQLLGVLLRVSSCCCLIWTKQLQLYSVRHSSSFARQANSERLRHVEQLIGGCHDDIVHYLTRCFNHPMIFEESTN
jgi:tetratricopeptide (TPR) repeat protein